MISQSDLPELLNVTVNVLPVLKPVLTVTLVMLTESTHQLVVVMLKEVIMKLAAIVKSVHTNAKPVTPLPNVGNVPETELNSHSVHVQTTPMTTVSQSVQNVLTDVMNVKVTQITVPIVTESETQSTTALAQLHTMKKLMEIVTLVMINVVLVLVTLPTVPVVLKEDTKCQNVHVYQEPMKTKWEPVLNVLIDALNVPLTDVSVVETESTPQNVVAEPITMTPECVIVKSVTTDVLNVSTGTNVPVLVLETEEIPLQTVHVHSVPTKLVLKSAHLVTILVNLVTTSMFVKPVTNSELTLHPVTVWTVTITLNTSVENVPTNVYSVTTPKITVTLVPLTESINHTVVAQLDTMITILKTHNVILVPLNV
jgi:hypothetical protein